MGNSNHSRRLLLLLLAVSGLVGCGDGLPENNPFDVVSGLYAPMDIAAAPDGGLIIVEANLSGFGFVRRIDGTDVTELASYGGHYVVVRDGYAYFANYDNTHQGYHVGRVPVAGGITEPFDVDRPVSGLAVDESYVYWIEQGVDEICRRAVGGGPAELLLDADDIWARLAVDDSHLYWPTNGGIARMPKVGGAVETVVSSSELDALMVARPTDIELTDRHVYFSACCGHSGFPGGVLRVQKDGAGLELLAPEQERAMAVTVDANYVYWVRGYPNRYLRYPGEQDIVRLPLLGGVEEVLAERQNGVTTILRRADGLYWNNSVGASIGFVPL